MVNKSMFIGSADIYMCVNMSTISDEQFLGYLAYHGDITTDDVRLLFMSLPVANTGVY